MSRVATICASIACSGDRPFSKRADASLRSPSLFDVAWMLGPCQLADSMSTRVVSGCDLRAHAAHDAGDRRRAVGVGDQAVVGVQDAGLAVERHDLLAVARAAHDEPAAGDAVGVEGVQRLAEQEHRVVRDVDDVVDRALARRPSGAP